jgi:hypothetical protein
MKTGLFFKGAVIILFIFFSGLPEVQAYKFYSDDTNDQGGCAQCHTGFRDNNNYISTAENFSWGNSLHTVHLNETNIGSICDHCHGGFDTSGRTVNIRSSAVAADGTNAIACMGCHGRLEDSNDVNLLGTGWGAGLRQHHFNAGQTSCAGCHADADPSKFSTTAEDIMPPWYGSVSNTAANLPLNPCNLNGVENLSGDPAGLGIDSDCIVIISGDVNNDGNINIADAITVLKAIGNVGGTVAYKDADINDDLKVGLEEAINALQIEANVREASATVATPAGEGD